MGALQSCRDQVPDGKLAVEVIRTGTEQFSASSSLGGRFYSGQLDAHKVAVKVLKRSESFEAEAFVKRAVTLCSISPHAHLLFPTGWSLTESESYVVYERIEGPTAASRLEKCRSTSGEAFPWAERLRLIAAVASALSYLRSCSKDSSHLNLKLSSIIYDRTGQVKLADFGFEGTEPSSTESNLTEAARDGLAELQVAELRDFGRLILELLLPDSQNAEAAARQASANAELEELLLSPLDLSASWPAALARDLTEVALTCTSAVAEPGRESRWSPPPGMASLASKLMELCVEYGDGPVSAPSPISSDDITAGFECIYSSEVDVSKLSDDLKTWTFTPGQVPWCVGRQHQKEIFACLVPDQKLCTCIARTHLELWPEKVAHDRLALRLHPTSQNPVVVDGKPMLLGPSGAADDILQNGSTISFCYRDEIFLTLRFSFKQSEFKPKERASTKDEFALLCDAVRDAGSDRLTGSRVRELPIEARSIQLKPQGSTAVGRQDQKGFFERLLLTSHASKSVGTGPEYVHFVSRKQFEIAPLPGDQQGFEIQNFSSNPIIVAGILLHEGSKAKIQVGDSVKFVVKDEDKLDTYLILRLHRLGTDPAGSAESSEVPAAHAMPFSLYIRGSALRQDFPESKRTLPGRPGPDGLTVGRAHQRSLHEKAFVHGIIGYISRDHFSITPGRHNFIIKPLSQNPIWHVRAGRQQRLMADDAAVDLEDEDIIMLYTGAEDLSAEGPGNLGTLQWVFRSSQASL